MLRNWIPRLHEMLKSSSRRHARGRTRQRAATRTRRMSGQPAEMLESRALLSAVSGAVFQDLDVNGFRNTDLIQGDEPDVIFIIDASGSTGNPFTGMPVGDLNNDGNADTILDAEIAAFTALNQQLINILTGNDFGILM